MMQYIKENWKRYATSSLVTFGTAFIFVLSGEIDSLSVETIKNGAYVGILFAAGRAGLKALLELWLTYIKTK